MTESVGKPAIDTSVIVVGAGPTGLMLACWLRTAGVAVEVVDAKSGPTVESRALGVQARTMEIYAQLGVIETVLAQCQQGQALAPGFEDRVFGRVPLGDLGRGITPYPRIYVLEQSKNERLLYDLLLRLGGSVRWRHRVTAVNVEHGDGETSAVVTADGPDQTLVLRARYCVGADGSSSVVRSLRGIDFAGVTNGRTYYVADAVRVRGLVPEAVNVRPARRDFLLTFPMGPDEHHRLIGIADEDAGRSDAEVEVSVRRRLAEVFRVEYESSRWFSTYRVHHRIAAAFRDGPFFLAGDAAHVHSPVGAQGMNTGLQDAHNLALKLVDVLQRGVSDAYLDSYDRERHPVAGRLVGTTDRLFQVVTSTSLLTRTLRRVVVPLLAPVLIRVVPRLRGSSRVFEYLSQTRIHYWMSPTARATGRRGRVVGRRLRWSGNNFEVLRSARWQVHSYAAPDPPGSVGAAAWQQLGRLGLELHRFPPAPRTALRSDLLYLVRPDGFVAAEAPRAHAVDVFGAALPDGLALEQEPGQDLSRSGGD